MLIQEFYSGAVDAEVGVWESELLNRPIQSAAMDEGTIRGQEMLKDIYKAFMGN